MDDKTSNASEPAQQLAAEQRTNTSPATQAEIVRSAGPSAEQAGTEHRKAYGTAKTENLRDSGLWRILLPGVVVLCCLALLAIPLLMLIWLLVISLDPLSPTGPGGTQLTWLWTVMIVIAIGTATIAIRGLIKIFMTQAINYQP